MTATTATIAPITPPTIDPVVVELSGDVSNGMQNQNIVRTVVIVL